MKRFFTIFWLMTVTAFSIQISSAADEVANPVKPVYNPYIGYITDLKTGTGDTAYFFRYLTVNYKATKLTYAPAKRNGRDVLALDTETVVADTFKSGIPFEFKAVGSSKDENIEHLCQAAIRANPNMQVGGLQRVNFREEAPGSRIRWEYEVELLKVSDVIKPAPGPFTGIFEGDGLVFQAGDTLDDEYTGKILFSAHSPGYYEGDDLFNFKANYSEADKKLVGDYGLKGAFDVGKFEAVLIDGKLQVTTIGRQPFIYLLDQQSSIQYDSNFVDLSATKLPPRYNGNDLFAVRENMQLIEPKDEFETTAAFQARLMKSTGLKGKPAYIATTLVLDTPEIRYDADNQMVTIDLKSKCLPYFYNSSIYGYIVKSRIDDNDKFTHIYLGVRNPQNFMIKAAPEVARKIKANAKALFLFRCPGIPSKANTTIQAEIGGIWIFDAVSGEIYAKS